MGYYRCLTLSQLPYLGQATEANLSNKTENTFYEFWQQCCAHNVQKASMCHCKIVAQSFVPKYRFLRGSEFMYTCLYFDVHDCRSPGHNLYMLIAKILTVVRLQRHLLSHVALKRLKLMLYRSIFMLQYSLRWGRWSIYGAKCWASEAEYCKGQ